MDLHTLIIGMNLLDLYVFKSIYVEHESTGYKWFKSIDNEYKPTGFKWICIHW